MNVYDFDRTIYNGDSTFDFYIYSLIRHPKIIFCLPSLVFAYCKYYIFNHGTKTDFKQTMYKFLRYCDTEKDVSDFWKKHTKKMKKWYLEQKRNDDIIISASPEFLLKPVADKFDFELIASSVSPIDGKHNGINCYYDEKVRRLYEIYPNITVDEFYSDSYSDTPLAQIADKAFVVKGNIISAWDFNMTKKVRK